MLLAQFGTSIAIGFISGTIAIMVLAAIAAWKNRH